MYDFTDPRSALTAPSPVQRDPADGFGAAEYIRFYKNRPQEEGPLAVTWYARSQNMIVAWIKAEAGAVFQRDNQPDEYSVLLPNGDSELHIVARGESKTVSGGSLVFVPPGPSSIRVVRAGSFACLFTSAATDLAAKCSNGARFGRQDPAVAPAMAWPAPPGGWKLRTYDLDVAPEPGRFGRIWCCTTLMVNVIDPLIGRRDPSKLSPHHHDDFEQCSLAVSGEFVHHLRWPWTANKRHWRDDQHEVCGSPSVVVVPPRAIHTTEACGPGLNQLVDLFCPPRRDFLQQPGWVLNAMDYPAP